MILVPFIILHALIFYISIHDLAALEVAQKIKAMGYLQDDM